MNGAPFFYMNPSVGGDIWENPAMAGAAGLFGILMAVYFLILLASSAVSIASYVLHSLGLYTIAKRRGIHHSWLAWIPVGSIWLLGSVSDQYQYVVKGKIKRRRLALLLMYIALVVLCIVWFVIAMVNAFSGSMDGVAADSASGAIIMIVAVLACSALSIVLTVFQYLAYYDLFVSCNPKNSVLFLVLSIVFPVTLPFFVFACWKKDEGMPPRKKTLVQRLVEVMGEEPDEPEQPEEPEEELVTEEGYAQPEEFVE